MTGLPCPRCQAPRPDGAVFCPSCGFNFAGESFSQRYGVAPVAAPAAVASRRSGPRLAIVALVVLVVGVAVAVVILMNQKVSTFPLATATDRPATFTPATEAPAPTFEAPAEEYMAGIGEAVPIIRVDDGSDLGTVAVLDGRRYTKVGAYLVADKGRAWIGAKVRYVAKAEFDYNLFDWVAHDADGNQYEPSGFPLDPELSGGTLAKGRKVVGWVPFEVPAAVKVLWVDYAPGGAVIFTVQVLP